MRLTQKFNESFNKIALRQEQPTTLVTTGYDAVTTTYNGFDMAASPVVLPPPPYPPDPAATTYYNFVSRNIAFIWENWNSPPLLPFLSLY